MSVKFDVIFTQLTHFIYETQWAINKNFQDNIKFTILGDVEFSVGFSEY